MTYFALHTLTIQKATVVKKIFKAKLKKKEKLQLSLEYNPKYIQITIYLSIYIYTLGILIQSYTKGIFKIAIITPK